MRRFLWLAAACLTTAAATVGSPAAAAARVDGPDLAVTVGEVTFGAGSVIGIGSLRLANTGPSWATDVSVRFELLRATTATPLEFTAQRQGCSMQSATVVNCEIPDVAPSSSTDVPPLYLPAIALGGVPGGSASIPMRLHITVRASQHDPTPADSTVDSTPIMSTVLSRPSDWSAVAAVDRHDSEYYYIRVASLGSAGTGEVVHTYRAPGGTEWSRPFPYPCLEIRPLIEYRCSSTSQTATAGTGSGGYDYLSLTLKIVGPITGDGEYRADPLAVDPDLANNSARIALLDPSPSAVPSVTSSAGPTLPVTGTSVALIAAAGIAAVAAGAALVLLVRRRRRTVMTG